jgi:hypothetical protein
MKRIRCPDCGEAVPMLARACGYCGAPNLARGRVAAAGAALAVLLVAGIAIALLVVRPGVPPGGSGTPVTKPAADKRDDFAWLTAAMKECDEDAAREPAALHFMVIPLLDQAKDLPGWRRISLNDVGNAILIKAEDTLAGLRRDALRISPVEYVFAVRNEPAEVVYKWSPSVGVKRYSMPNAEDVTNFRVQFQTRDGVAGPEWGATFVRRKGNCYWVNAIILLGQP